MTLKFYGRPWKTIGHLFYTHSSFMHHFTIFHPLNHPKLPSIHWISPLASASLCPPIVDRHSATLPPYYQCTLHKLREEMVKYSPVSIISLSLIRMPASDNPYKSLRAIPYLKYRVILLIPPSGCISAGWGMAWGLLRQQAINQPGPGFIATGFSKIPWHFPDSIHISLTKRNNKSVNDRF